MLLLSAFKKEKEICNLGVVIDSINVFSSSEKSVNLIARRASVEKYRAKDIKYVRTIELKLLKELKVC